jgi:hypothetical protein
MTFLASPGSPAENVRLQAFVSSHVEPLAFISIAGEWQKISSVVILAQQLDLDAGQRLNICIKFHETRFA